MDWKFEVETKLCFFQLCRANATGELGSGDTSQRLACLIVPNIHFYRHNWHYKLNLQI